MTTFEKLSRMADADMDIRLAALDNIVAIRILGTKGGEVTFGVDGQTTMDLIAGRRFVGGFLLADRAQFDSISDEEELISMPKGLAFMVRYIEFHGHERPMEIITEHHDEDSARKGGVLMKKKYGDGDILIYKRIEDSRSEADDCEDR
jgi:hypothetical protein